MSVVLCIFSPIYAVGNMLQCLVLILLCLYKSAYVHMALSVYMHCLHVSGEGTGNSNNSVS